jgi:hypothetical protein
VHPPGDGGFGNAKDLGGLGMGELLARDEDHGVAEGGLQAGDGAFDPDGIVKVAAVGLFGEADEHGQLLAEGAEGTAATAPVAAGVEGDAMKPSGELGLAAIAADLLDQGAADVLGDVVGVGPRSGQLPGEPVDAIVMAFEQRCERVTIAGGSGCDETRIWFAADIRPLTRRAGSS